MFTGHCHWEETAGVEADQRLLLRRPGPKGAGLFMIPMTTKAAFWGQR